MVTSAGPVRPLPAGISMVPAFVEAAAVVGWAAASGTESIGWAAISSRRAVPWAWPGRLISPVATRRVVASLAPTPARTR